MSTTYDEVHREAVHDAYAHDFDPPTAGPADITCDLCDGDLPIDPDTGGAVPCPDCNGGDGPGRFLPSDEVLELWAEEHRADRQAGAFADGPEAAA